MEVKRDIHFSIIQERVTIQYGQVMEWSDTVCNSERKWQ